MVGKVVGHHPEIPEGVYLCKYIGYETRHSWNSDKIILKFSIVDGDWAGVPLFRYYNAIRILKPIGPDGDFEIGDRSHLVKEFRTLFPEARAISEVDPNAYKGHLIRVQVESTNKTGTGEELAESNQYSVIRKLLEIVPESYENESLTKLG